jgi:CMP-N,N'-diacetyllegionaminic acid synthase
MRCVSIIPARGGSKGVPRKNIKPFAGKPLIAHTILHSLQTPCISETYVSTDDPEIQRVARDQGATVILRPSELAEDTSPLEPVLTHALSSMSQKPDLVVVLQCTSPLRRPDDIENAVNTLLETNVDSVFSATRNKDLFWRCTNEHLEPINYDYKNRQRRQDMPQEYIENGSIYVFRTNVFLKEGHHLCGTIGVYEMPREYSFEIDDPFDFWLCEKITEWLTNERD